MAQNPHRHQCRARCRGRGSGWGAGGWRKPGNCTHGRCHGETNLAQQEPRRAASVQNSPSTPPSHRMCGTKLSQHEPHGPTSGTKLSLLTRNGSIWRFFYMQGEFYTVVTAKKLSRENFVPNAGQSWGSPTGHRARQVWRVPEGPVWRAPEGRAAVPVVGGGAWPQCQWITGPGRGARG